MTDDDDLLGVTGAGDLRQILGKTVDTLVPFRPRAVREFPGPDRVAEQIEQIGGVFRVFQQGAENGHEQRRCRGDTQRVGHAEGMQALAEADRRAERNQRFDEQHQVRIADESRKPPMRVPEARDGAAEHQPPVDPGGVVVRVFGV